MTALLSVNMRPRMQRIVNLVCEARNLADELENDLAEYDGTETLQLLAMTWRDELESIEGDIDDFLDN